MTHLGSQQLLMDQISGQLHEGNCSALVQLSYAGLAGHLML